MKLILLFWRKRRNLFAIWLVQTFALYILLTCLSNLVTIASSPYLKNAKQNYYKLYDNFVGKAEKDFFYSQDSIEKIKKFCLWLYTNNSFDYEIINTQDLFISHTNKTLDSIQVNPKFFSLNNVKIKEGTGFSETDYFIDSFNAVIPVLLGNNISGFELGDNFKFYYMGVELKGKIVGILSDNSSYMLRGNVKKMENVIVIPSLNFSRYPSNQKEWDFQIKLYLDKTAGIIVTEEPAKIIQNEIDEICSSLKLLNYGLEGYRNQSPNFWGSMGNELKRINVLFLFYVGLIFILQFSLECRSRLMQISRKYSILCLLGFFRRQLILGVMAGIFLDLLIPFFIVLSIDFLFFKNIHIYLYLVVYIIIAWIIAVFGCMFVIRKDSYWRNMRGKKYGNLQS